MKDISWALNSANRTRTRSLSVGAATEVVTDFIEDLAHKPPIVLVDHIDEIVGADIGHQIRGAVFGGKIYLVRSAFRDGDVSGMRRTLWHELPPLWIAAVLDRR